MNLTYKITYALLLCSTALIQAHEWVNPTPEICTSYMYAPGVLGSEILMGRYCPSFVASTGETITCSKGIEVIRTPATGTNMTEISIKKLSRKEIKEQRKLRKKSTPKQSFFNLLLTPFRAFWYTASYLSNHIMGFTISRPKDAKKRTKHESLSMYWADPRKVNLAQDADLKLFKNAYEQHLEQRILEGCTHNNIILYGASRGSATVFNFNALEHPQEVRAVICEGLFDSIEHIAETTNSGRVRMLIKLLPKVTDFKHNGILPINLIDRMPKDVPILLITSHNDSIVPYECTMNIYNGLRTAGHTKAHILVLDKATHAWYPYCSKKERTLYQAIVHAFYKHYGLPYIAEFADNGAEWFATKTQPDYQKPTHLPAPLTV